ncbi:hypothetical protein CEXT_135881, partial [Caerostris extrusa]
WKFPQRSRYPSKKILEISQSKPVSAVQGHFVMLIIQLNIVASAIRDGVYIHS